jgi:hypothetical protein
MLSRREFSFKLQSSSWCGWYAWSQC